MTSLISKMFEKNQQYFLEVLNGILWLSIFYVSFSSSIRSHNVIHDLSKIDAIFREVLNGTYVSFLQWVVIIVTLYFLIKLSLFKWLPKSHKITLKGFAVMRWLDEPKAVALENVYWKHNRARRLNRRIVKQLMKDEGFDREKIRNFQLNIQLIVSALLKLLILTILHVFQDHSLIVLDAFSIIFIICLILVSEFHYLRYSGYAKIENGLADLKSL